MAERNSGTATASDQELVITRVFDAPRELVWKAWTVDMAKWSAPRGFTMPVSEGDVRPGGKWRAMMKTAEGKELWLGGEYHEVAPPERLVFSHQWDSDKAKPGAESVVTVVLVEISGKTEMTFTQTGFTSTESRDGHKDGWTECFDILDELFAAEK